MRRVTIRDVAAEAGVSIGTASKALSGLVLRRGEGCRPESAAVALSSRAMAQDCVYHVENW